MQSKAWGDDMAWQEVARVDEIREGAAKVVSVNGEDVAVFLVDGQYHAIANTCPHKGGPLGDGVLDGCVVTCPWHGWKFDVTTGVSAVVKSVSVPKYNVKVEGDKVWVEA